MTASIISISTRQPLPIPLAVSHWTPAKGDRVDVLIPQMPGDAPLRQAGVVKGFACGVWVVQVDGRQIPVTLAEMRPAGNQQPEPPRAA